MKRRPTISVCMIVKNEEKDLPRLLSSIKGLADETIIVDTGSNDNTVDIAKSYGAKVYHFPWCNDFSAARNESLKYATKDYILWLDADDEIKHEEHHKIRNDLKRYKGAGLFLRLKNVYGDSGTDFLQLRIFPNHKGIIFEGRVHEQAIHCLEEKMIPTYASEAQVLHHGYDTNENVAEKSKRNRDILEIEIKERPDNINALFFMSKALRGLGEKERALACLDRLMELARLDPSLYMKDVIMLGASDKAAVLYELGKEDEMLSFLLECKTLFPNDVLILYLLGEQYYRRKDYENAYKELINLQDETFTKLLTPINIHETRMCLLNHLGISSLFTGDFLTAERCFKKLIDNDPMDKANYHYLSLVKEKAGDIEGAISACDEGLKRHAMDSYLMKRKYLLYLSKESYAEALEIYEDLNGYSNDVEVTAGRFLIACKSLHVQDMQRYYQILQEKLSIFPKPFPENFSETKDRLSGLEDKKGESLFDSAINFLLKK
ncbi:MAG: glycosyltransferase [Syntrophorhabdaceae bacterium]|nr:glycosyltransferase [Syntrophorhabdaceae bacterium]